MPSAKQQGPKGPSLCKLCIVNIFASYKCREIYENFLKSIQPFRRNCPDNKWLHIVNIFGSYKCRDMNFSWNSSNIWYYIYKLKGNKGDFNSYRGIFRVPIFRTILDRLIYNDQYEVIDEALSDSNVGARKNRNVRDNIFVLNAITKSVINGYTSIWYWKVLWRIMGTRMHQWCIWNRC